MAETLTDAPVDQARTSEEGALARFLRATELDTRMLGMVGALLLIWIGLQILSSLRLGVSPLEFDARAFLSPRNLWNLSVQSSSIAIMATGMVLVIVTRNIDLSVGSLLGFVGMIMGVTQAEFLSRVMGIPLGHPSVWMIALAAGIVVGVGIGAIQGFLIAFAGIPAFIVTLGGLLVWRGAAWWVTSGRTVAPMDPTFRLMGGGPAGSIGATWSWVVAVVACLGVVFLLLSGRRQRIRFSFPLRPIWAEALLGSVSCAVILGAVWVANSYPWPIGIVRRHFQDQGLEVPQGVFIAHGIAIPVLIAIAVGVVMTFISTRTRFGRYVFAIGGNPEAAMLAGIQVRWVTLKIFMLMGLLVSLSAAVSTARLNAATNATGALDELLVIAAAVIGGTSLSGGVGTVAGAMIGAVLMQSLASGMILLGVDTPLQNIVVGSALVLAVWLDTVYRKRSK